jgi:hypothetical protein
LSAAIALLALVVGMIVPAAAGDNGDSRTLRVAAITTEQAFVDVGEKGFSLGDEFIFHDNLLKGGEKVGHDGGVCTATSLEEGAIGEFQCVVTAWFKNGQITVQGLIQPTEEFPEHFILAITGGSGAYKGADGQVRVVRQTETRAVITFHLEG